MMTRALSLTLIMTTGIFGPVCFSQAFDFKKRKVNEPIQPLPQHKSLDPAKVQLGEQLFFDKKLSQDNSIACVSCHGLNTGGTDRLPVSKGIGGALGNRNAPTVFNSMFNFRQFWDGRAKSLEEQIDGPIHNPKEMASSWTEILGKLRGDPEYRQTFSKIYQAGITEHTIKDAIATFERSLITPNAPFDRYLRGDKDAITADEKEGYRLFKSYGCVACHQGVNVGGNMFQEFGIFAEYSKNLKGQKFKVPSLRNVALTYPYFHDGSAKTLNEAIRAMAQYQLGRTLTEKEVSLISKFLHTLTGTYKGKALDDAKK